jgi:hypothetical protein
MKRLISLFVIVAGSLALTASAAEVNCKQVNKYLQTGRTPQDVADTMVVSVDDVKKCQEAEKSAAGAAAPSGGGGTTAPSGGSGTTAQPEGSKAK